MASSNGKCVKCNRGRVKIGSTLCTACTRKNGLTQAQKSDYSDVVILVSEPLMYAQYHRDCASRDSIVKVTAFYTSDTLSEAKCMLWSHFEDSNILEPMQTRLTSCNRTDREAMSDDIQRGIGSLIENGIKVQCVARDWKLIPKSHPEGVNELSLAEKLADLEGELKVLVDTLDGIKSEDATNIL